jgi:hypothetical protein
MRQAVHIFKKDVRGLTYEIVVTLALVVIFAAVDSGRDLMNLNDSWLPGVLKLLLPLSWWVLTARLIQNEAIVGDRQFWLTRPYSRASLLVAKLALLLAFVCIPMMISDAMILHGQGFSVPAHTDGILWEMVLRFNVFVLPAVIVASLTTSLGTFTITGLIAMVMIVLNLQFQAGYQVGRGFVPWSEYDWAFSAIEASLIPAAIVFQYARWKKIALALAICALLLPIATPRFFGLLFPFPGASAAGSTGGPTVQFKIDPKPKRIFFPRSTYKPDEVPGVLPIEISGIPEGLQMRASQLIVRWSTDGKVWRGSSGSSLAFLTPDHSFPDSRFFWLEIKVPKDFYQQAEQETGWKVIFNIWVDLTLYRNLSSTDVAEREFPLPGVGYCESSLQQPSLLYCRSALRRPSIPISVYDSAGYYSSGIQFPRSPFPAELGISPIVTSNFSINGKNMELLTGEPVYHLQRAFDLSPVRLEDYVELRAK